MKAKFSTGYLTPQATGSRKAQKTKHSDSDNLDSFAKISDDVFDKLMSCPIKRKLVLKLIESQKDNIEEYKKKKLKENERREQNASPLKRLQKKQLCESPTALLRRRALEQQQNHSSSSMGNIIESRPISVNSRTSETSSSNPSPIPFEKLLDGVVAFVEVKSKGQDRSNGVKALMVSMGAYIKDSFTADVTHVVFKDGSYTTFQKAKLKNIHLVSVLWVEAVRSNCARVPEKKFPALGTEAYDHNVSTICSQMQKEYEEIIKDELQRSLITGTPLPSTKTLIDKRRTIMASNISRSSTCKDMSQETSSQDKEVEQIVSRARIPERMTMGFLNSLVDEPELTSDDDDSRCGAIINGDVISKKDRLSLVLQDVTNDNNSNMDLTNIENRPVITPNMRRNLFNNNEDSPSTPSDNFDTTIDENIYDLQTPKLKRTHQSGIEDEHLCDNENDSLFKRRTKSLINNGNDSNLFILSRNSCYVSPVAPIIHSNVLLDRKTDSGAIEKSSNTNMPILQISSECKSKEKSTKRKSGSFEKNLSSDMSSLKISNEKSSSTNVPSLRLSEKSSSTNMSVLQVSSDKTSLQKTSSTNMSSLQLSSEKRIEKSSSTNLSMLQLSSEIENVGKGTDKSVQPSDRLHQKNLFKRPSSSKSEGSFNSVDKSFSPLQTKVISVILQTLDIPPSADDNANARRKTESVITPLYKDIIESAQDIEQSESVANSSGVSPTKKIKISKRKSLITRPNKKYNPESGKIAIEKGRDEKTVVSSTNKSEVNITPVNKSVSSGSKLKKGTNQEQSISINGSSLKNLRGQTKRNKETPFGGGETKEDNNPESAVSKVTDKSIYTLSTKELIVVPETRRRKSLATLSNGTSDSDCTDIDASELQKSLSDVSSKKISKDGDEDTRKGQILNEIVHKVKTPVVRSSIRTRRIRKLYNPDDVIGVATERISKLSDEDERQLKRKQVVTESSSNDVIITLDVLPVQLNLVTHENNRDCENSDDDCSLNETDESEIEIPIKSTRKKKNNNITVNGDRDEQVDLAREILGKPNRTSKKSRSYKNKSNPNSSTSSRTSDDEHIEKERTRSKRVSVSKSTGTITRRRQSERLFNSVTKTNLNIPDNNMVVPITPAKNRRSTMEFQTKSEISARRRLKIDKLKRPSIVCTKLHRDNIMIFNQIVRKLGKFVIEDEVSNKTTHLVAGEPKRTINMLRAIATGCWILKHQWVLRSLEAGRWLPEEDYEEIDFSSAVQKSRLHRQAFGPTYSMDVFKECEQIYVARGTVPRCSDLRELITLCQGKVTTILRNAAIVVGGYKDEPQVKCVKETWVLDSISMYKKMPFKNYLIKSDNGVII